ncbi:MAG: PQQ-binding-like beta-propeller repeat protein [Steroidobacterales bacterium]
MVTALAGLSCGMPALALPSPCENAPGPVAVGTAQWNGWGRDTDNSRYQPEPALRAADVSRLAVKWAYGYTGADDAGPPAVVDGRLFVGDSLGSVYALDARTGCSYWIFAASATVHTAITVGELAAAKTARSPKPSRKRHARIDAHVEVQKPPSAVFFGDAAGAIYSVDAQRGNLLWKTQVDPDPGLRIAGAPMLYIKGLYVSLSPAPGAGASGQGAIAAFDLWTGKLLWKTVLDVRSGPTIDAERQLLYVTTQDGLAALDLADGSQRWQRRAPAAAEFRHAPILRRLQGGQQILIVAGRDGAVYGFDPARAGEILWQAHVGPEHAEVRIDWGAAADHRNLYVGTAAEGLTALDITTGKQRWSAPMPRAPAHAVTAIPGMLFAGSLDGHLRAYSTIGGKVVWDIDTARPYPTRNDVPASGGAPGHGGVIVVDGMVYVNSGNALLAFSVDGK